MEINRLRPFPIEYDMFGRPHPKFPDGFPLEKERRTVLGIPVLTMGEYQQLNEFNLETRCLVDYSNKIRTYNGIPFIDEIDAYNVERAVAILEAARKSWTGRPRDWSREEAIFKALTGNRDENE